MKTLLDNKKKLYISLHSLALTSLFALASCGLPNPYDFSPATPPTLTSTWDGNEATLIISGPFTEKNYPKLEGFNLYFSDNNDPYEINKRLLYLDDKDEQPSVEFYWRGFDNSNAFEKSVTLPKSLSFRLTKEATSIDLLDEQVDSKDTLIENKENWEFSPYKKFYFYARSVINGVESSKSSTILIEIPNITTTNIPLLENLTFAEKEGNPSLTFKFDNSDGHQKMLFGFVTEGTSSLTPTYGLQSVEVYNYGYQENWQTVPHPTSGFTSSPENYAEGYLLFFRRLNDGYSVSNLHVHIDAITDSNVSLTIWEFTSD